MIGNLGGVMLIALVSALIYLVVGFAAGMDFEAGPLGVLALLALALLISLAFAALGGTWACDRARARPCRGSSRCSSSCSSCPR